MGCLLKANGLYSRTTIGAVLLAAGAGSRLGHRPKALLELGGVPLIVRQCVALSGAGVDELVVVLGHHADAIEPAVAPFPITIVRNPAPDRGQHTSVRLGLQALVAAARCGDRGAGRSALDRRGRHRGADRRLQEARRRVDGGAARRGRMASRCPATR